jgi:hypothetical protein
MLDVVTSILGWISELAQQHPILFGCWRLPHVWITCGTGWWLFRRAYKSRTWPTERQLIEVLAYGAGMYGAFTLVRLAVVPPAGVTDDTAWQLVIGGVVLGYAALRGLIDVISSVGRSASVADDAAGDEPEPDDGEYVIEGTVDDFGTADAAATNGPSAPSVAAAAPVTAANDTQ